MPVVIGVPKESVEGERRVAVVPDIIKKYKALGAEVRTECGAGTECYFRDEEFGGAIAASSAEIFSQSSVVMTVHPPTLDNIRQMRPASVLIGFLHPYQDPERAKVLCERRVTSFAVELIPRISRAQSMDALSSQATIAGYQCALIAAVISPKFFPSRVLVVGAGVAGLQTIATAHRLGAIVEAYDVRPETREQVESLGARFVDTGVTAVGAGGYARELTQEERSLQQERLSKAISQVDVLITTAAIPGKKSPRIVTEDMVARMKKGAIIVDMAADSGGNVAGSRAGETVVKDGITIVGTANLASRMPVHASDMYSRNLYNFLSPFVKDGNLALDWNDEILLGSCFTHEGKIQHEGVRKALEEK
jgi:proton-translocating NAD(P)+ transhydrogenase subunit alpha